MTISKHAIERFRERVTWESNEVIRSFIEYDIESSELLYRLNNIEKRLANGIVYVLDCTKGSPTVITLYLA